MPRQLHLTPELVARVPPYDGPPLTGGNRDLATDEDHAAVFAHLMATRPVEEPVDRQVWLFAYGSLIWKPNFAHDAESVAHVRGWHRSFCIGWMQAFRGCPDRPGLMMALDHGGSCWGVAFRLLEGQMEENLMALIRREMPFKVSGMTARWLRGSTPDGPRVMIGFPVNRQTDSYVAGVTEERLVAVLATSAGPVGTMAEYLASTVQHLEDRGIHDRYLWRMQELVAARIAALHPA